VRAVHARHRLEAALTLTPSRRERGPRASPSRHAPRSAPWSWALNRLWSWRRAARLTTVTRTTREYGWKSPMFAPYNCADR